MFQFNTNLYQQRKTDDTGVISKIPSKCAKAELKSSAIVSQKDLDDDLPVTAGPFYQASNNSMSKSNTITIDNEEVSMADITETTDKSDAMV